MWGIGSGSAACRASRSGGASGTAAAAQHCALVVARFRVLDTIGNCSGTRWEVTSVQVVGLGMVRRGARQSRNLTSSTHPPTPALLIPRRPSWPACHRNWRLRSCSCAPRRRRPQRPSPRLPPRLPWLRRCANWVIKLSCEQLVAATAHRTATPHISQLHTRCCLPHRRPPPPRSWRRRTARRPRLCKPRSRCCGSSAPLARRRRRRSRER